MALTTKIVFILTGLSFFFGQLARVSILNVSFPIIDVFVVLLSLLNLYSNIRNHTRISNKLIITFIVYLWLIFIFNNILLNSTFPAKSFMYLLRLSSLLSFFVYPIPKKMVNNKFCFLVLLSAVMFGLLQYILWPDLTVLKSLHWDPHLYRLTGAYFDPTFTGIIFLLFLILAYFHPHKKNKFLILAIIYIAISLTYSRSTFLSLVIASLFISLKTKSIRHFLFATTIVLITLFILPKYPGEGTKLSRTSTIKAKIVNYQEGFDLFLRSPIIGHTYNNLELVRYQSDKSNYSHSLSGFDSSAMTILTTSGIVGLLLSILAFFQIYHHVSLPFQTMLTALVVHSLFANSFLYPWVLYLLAVTYPKYRK